MRGIKEETLRRSKTRVYAGFLVLAMLVPVFGGCAAGPGKQARISHGPAAGTEPSAEPVVARLDDGRKGFVITEFPQADEASQKDFDRAVSMLKDGDYDEAIALLEKVIEKSPGVTAPYVDIAMAYRRTGRPEQAEKNLKAALKLFPGQPVALNEYGLLCRESGRFKEARAMYEKAIAGFGEYYPAHRNLGILCDLYLSDPACALQQYEIYSEARPDDVQVKLWIADLSARLGRK